MVTQIDIEKVKKGDETEFNRFFHFFYPKLMGLACRFVDDQIAKDLVQEIFTSYWEQKETIEAERIHSFLYKWLQNKCLDHIKHQLVVEEYESRVRIAESRLSFLGSSSDTNDVLKQIINQDLREIIETSVDKLPPKCAQAFRLCYFHDMTHKEIARAMNISPRTVEVHIYQAVKFLRKDLKDLFLLIFLLTPLN